MNFSTLKFSLKALLFLFLSNIAVYGLYHIAYLINVTWVYGIFDFIEGAWSYIFPALCVLSALVLYVFSGVKLSLAVLPIFVLTNLFYLIPSYYIDYLEPYSPVFVRSSSDAIIMSLMTTGITILINIIICYLIFGAAMLAYRIVTKTKLGRTFEHRLSLGKSMAKKTIFNFTHPITSVILSISMAMFIANLGSFIYSTALFFKDVGNTYSVTEIVSIMLNFLWLIVLLVVCHFILAKVKNYIFRNNYKLSRKKKAS